MGNFHPAVTLSGEQQAGVCAFSHAAPDSYFPRPTAAGGMNKLKKQGQGNWGGFLCHLLN